MSVVSTLGASDGTPGFGKYKEQDNVFAPGYNVARDDLVKDGIGYVDRVLLLYGVTIENNDHGTPPVISYLGTSWPVAQ